MSRLRNRETAQRVLSSTFAVDLLADLLDEIDGIRTMPCNDAQLDKVRAVIMARERLDT